MSRGRGRVGGIWGRGKVELYACMGARCYRFFIYLYPKHVLSVTVTVTRITRTRKFATTNEQNS